MVKNKITSVTDNSKWVAPKTRKKRKPMSDEQKVAAAERLALAREKRAELNPDYGKSGYHQSLHDLPKDHNLHPNKVKLWMKTQKELAASERANVKKEFKGSVARLSSHDGYVRQMQSYLKHGDWVSNFYGEYQEKKIKWKNIALAYYFEGPKKGQPKRDVGTFYPDLGLVWESDMAE
jgi:hypothetical protein